MVHVIEYLAPFLVFLERFLLALLVFLEFAIVAIFVWRWRAFSQAGGKPEKWVAALTSGVASPQPEVAVVDEKDAATVPGRVVKTGLANLNLAPEALEKVFDVQESAEKRELDQGLSFLGTVGANAPFVGLTGTVIGILVAFDRFAASGGRGSTEVMLAISQALIATALGLMVAIPAVVFYNVLRNRSRRILEQARELRGLLVARSLQTTLGREG